MAIALGLVMLSLPMACTTTVVAPERPGEPSEVVLLDHGRHASVLLPKESGGMVRYAYGDWGWYALRDRGPLGAMAALLIPTQGALGRHTIQGPVEPAEVHREIRVVVEQRWRIAVERSRAESLRRRLDRVWQRAAEGAVWNPESRLRFVRHPESYSYFHNSNHAAAEWLRALGCEVRGPAFGSSWRVEGDEGG